MGVPDGTAARWDSEDRESEEQSEGEPDSESEGGSDVPILRAKNGNKNASTDRKRRPDLRETIPKDEHPRILALVDEHGWDGRVAIAPRALPSHLLKLRHGCSRDE